MSSPIEIGPMLASDARAVAALADRTVGVDYFPIAEVQALVGRCTRDGQVHAWVAREALRVAGQRGEIVAFRFAFPPGLWATDDSGLTPARWPAAPERAAYFKSCFVDPAVTGRGIGRQLSLVALDALKAAGAETVIAHCWKESPHDSSRRYLTRLGFRAVAEFPDHWIDVDYICSRDGFPCRCTAIEMVLDLRTPNTDANP